MVQLIIVDDSVIIQNTLEYILKDKTVYNVLFKASNGLEAIKLLNSTKAKPTIAIVDINMPVIDGVSFTQYVANKYKDISIIGFSVHDHVEAFSAILEAGAKGFIIKENVALLPEAIIVVQNGKTFIDPSLITKWEIYQKNKALKLNIAPSVKFNEKQIEYLILAPTDLTAKELASITNQSTHTINQHKKDVKKKTGVSTRTAQAFYAFKVGIIKTFKL